MSEKDLVDAWRELDLTKPPYILRGDDSLREANSRDVLHNYRSYETYIEDEDHGRDHNKFPFHSGLIPVPYAGCLSRAKMFFLMANPGFQSLDYYAEYSVKEFRPRALRQLRQENREDEYPMLYLDPKFAWHGGGEYWRKKFGWLLSIMQGSYVDCLRLLSQNIAVLEYVPYHSTKSTGDKKLKSMLSQLRSVKLMQAFVNSLVERANDEVFIVDMRGGWSCEKYAKRRNIVIYKGPQRRSAQISAKNPGIDKIIQFLQDRCGLKRKKS